MISAVVLTKNEEKNIRRCLESLEWCDELIIVDDFSTDATLTIAKEYKAKIYQRELAGDFSGQRNFACQKSQGEWILFLDADEEIPEKLGNEIALKITCKKIDGFCLKRKDFLFGRWLDHGETSTVKLLRIARKGKGRWLRRVDEIWNVPGPKETLSSHLLHYSHPTISEFLKSINERSSLNALQLYSDNQKVRMTDWVKPFFKFIKNYFFCFGFLDGIQGFLMAVMMSFHSFLVRGKLYLIWKKEAGWHEI